MYTQNQELMYGKTGFGLWWPHQLHIVQETAVKSNVGSFNGDIPNNRRVACALLKKIYINVVNIRAI